MTTLTIVALGQPVPQGSKTMITRTLASGASMSRMIEASNRLKPWRATLVEEAREAVLEQGWQRLVDTPIRLTLTFTMTPSQKDALSILKRPGAYPAWRMPDLDKLVRAVGDALTQAETVWDDDSRVTNLLARKGYAGAEGFMRQPGVVIELREQRV